MAITNFMNNIPQDSENARGDLSDQSDVSDVSDVLVCWCFLLPGILLMISGISSNRMPAVLLRNMPAQKG
jgi:hypothetical protein